MHREGLKGFKGTLILLNPYLKGFKHVCNEIQLSFLICFISKLNDIYWKRDESLNIKIYKCLVSTSTNMSNFQPLEVVGRGSNFGLVEMATSTNLKPTICHNLYENTGPAYHTHSGFRLDDDQ